MEGLLLDDLNEILGILVGCKVMRPKFQLLGMHKITRVVVFITIKYGITSSPKNETSKCEFGYTPTTPSRMQSPELILLSEKRRLDMQLIMPLVVAYMAAENHSQTSGVGVSTALRYPNESSIDLFDLRERQSHLVPI